MIIGNREIRVLDQTGIVRQTAKMAQVEQGQVRRPRVQGRNPQSRSRLAGPFLRRLNEGFQVPMRDFGPDHLAAVHKGSLPHRMPLRFVIKQIDNLIGDSLRIPERPL